MARIRPKNTKPEMRLRHALWEEGLRYRLHYKINRIRPDLVFIGKKVAIFIDGCQWHGCPEHYVRPKTREDFWQAKLLENVNRDSQQTLFLKSNGWSVYRIWEHEIWEDLPKVVFNIKRMVCEQHFQTDNNWRVFRVDVIDEATNRERRYLRLLESPDTITFIDKIRSTKKWHRSIEI